MGEATNMYPNLDNQTFRLNRINENRDYLIAEIHERTYLNLFLPLEQFDKSLIFYLKQVVALLLLYLLLLLVLL